MKKGIIIVIILLGICTTSRTQSTQNVSDEEIKIMVNQIADSLAFYYVSLEQGKMIGKHMINAEKKGAFTNITNSDSLARQMTRELRSVNGDLHLSLSYIKPKIGNKERYSFLADRKRYSDANFGLGEVKILEGNVGYLKINHFSNWTFIEETQTAMTSAMGFLQNSNAIIFDVRDNRGGVPNLVAYLCSYLFGPERVHLAQYTHRYQDSGYGLYTFKTLPGKRLPYVPVYVLVNEKSASAAEEFAYFLKHQKRATIVGDTTAGAGYGAMSHRLNDRFSVSISSEEDINPITNSNFEQVGVIPDIYAKGSDVFDLAYDLAVQAAKNFDREKETKYGHLLTSFEDISENKDIDDVIKIIEACHYETLFNRRKINSIGYELLPKAPEIAEAVFKLNTEWYPNNSNVFDSYGDGLKTVGKIREALDSYEQALKLGKLSNSTNVEYYAKNVEEMKKRLEIEKANRE